MKDIRVPSKNTLAEFILAVEDLIEDYEEKGLNVNTIWEGLETAYSEYFEEDLLDDFYDDEDFDWEDYS